jgi:integrase
VARVLFTVFSHNLDPAGIPHTFATDLRRVADLGATSQALGHSDLSTTASIYGHYDLNDLERAMEALAQVRRSEEEEEPAD